MELTSENALPDSLLPKALSTLREHLPNYFGVSIFFPAITESAACLLDSSAECDRNFKVKLIKGGITNNLLKVTHTKAKRNACLIRYYGPKTEHIINREREHALCVYLEKFNIGKKVYARFEGGQIEEWIRGRSIESIEMGDVDIMPFVAKKMAELHALPIPYDLYLMHYSNNETRISEKAETKSSLLWETIWKYYKLCKEKIKDDSTRFKRLELFNFDATYHILVEIEKEAKLLASPVCLCHCDLLSGNIVKLEQGGIQFIDFEYGIAAERAFDIANHFNEYAGFECNWKNLPSEAQQRAFLAHYSRNHPDKPSVDILFMEIQVFRLVSHAYWGLWSLVQAVYSDIDFDFWGYGFRKLSALFHLYTANTL